jgi:hypothetical protein
MAVVQSTYRAQMHPATPGMPADMRNWDGITRTCEVAAGIGFGLAVGRGDDDPETMVKLGGTLVDWLGVSYRDITLDHAATTLDKYAETENVGICTRGTVWVVVSGSPTVDSPVHYNATTGVFAGSGGTGPVRGARFMSDPVTVANSVQVIKLNLSGDNQAAA